MSDSGDNFNELVVEKVLRVRMCNGRKEYLLKWKDQPESKSTWETEENLDCPELIRQFEENAKKLSKPRSSTRASGVASSETGSVKDAEATKNDTATTVPSNPQDGAKPTDSEPKKISRKRKNPGSREGDTTKSGEENEGQDENGVETVSSVKRQVLSELLTSGGNAHVEEFERNLKVDRIIGVTEYSGKLMFLIKWQGTNTANLVPAKEANVKCPQAVIKFYEERLTWHTPNS